MSAPRGVKTSGHEFLGRTETLEVEKQPDDVFLEMKQAGVSVDRNIWVI